MSKEFETLPPPPYSEGAVDGTRSFASGNPSLYNAHLASHLSSLPARLRESQQARSTQQAADDLNLITHMVWHIEHFLADITSLDQSPPPLAELTLVPASAISTAWTLSHARERRREGELVQTVRVNVASGPDDVKGGGSGVDSKGGAATTIATGTSSSLPNRDWSSTTQLFDEWGRWDEDAERAAAAASGSSYAANPGTWWWGDERMARRLASYLHPKTLVKTARREIQAAVANPPKEEKKKSSSGWGWGRRRGESSTKSSASPTSLSAAPAATTPKPPILPPEESVNMTVRAEEVTFQRENEFGVWESMSGWGIVVAVTIRR